MRPVHLATLLQSAQAAIRAGQVLPQTLRMCTPPVRVVRSRTGDLEAVPPIEREVLDHRLVRVEAHLGVPVSRGLHLGPAQQRPAAALSLTAWSDCDVLDQDMAVSP
nr:hypothetical protein [Mumia sp. zg.B17]